jgi:cysteine synthase B
MSFRTLQDYVGNTPLVRLTRIPGEDNARRNNVILAKLEGNNPAGSVKDRPALSMIAKAEARGRIKPGDTLIEATSGNTGIALAMAAAMRGYRMILIMPENQSVERCQTMRAFGAELILTPKAGSMEAARDLADQMVATARASCSTSSPTRTTRWRITRAPDRKSGATRTVASRISSPAWAPPAPSWAARASSRKEPAIRIVGCQPEEGAQIPGIRKWPEAYLPKIYDGSRVDQVESVGQGPAEEMARRLAREEGIFAGISSGGALVAALRIGGQTENAVIVSIVCDRGDRYLSTGVFPA